ncbi:hypothetical protein [Candidatus Electronema sp. PJ]|uniref:hypothetical protein n=1 Tax=Candidatus Electronema sp. PJ TaxID=3401572 RepID=UPI003AA948AB
MHKNRCRVGITALGLSFLALLLSVFPACLLDKKRAVLEQLCTDQTAAFSFNCNETNQDCTTAAEHCVSALKEQSQRQRLCKHAMILAACSAIGAAVWSWRKERVKEFCLFSITSSLVALSWQQVGAVLAVSIALLVFTVLAARIT